jgi:SAM-dependent methyltransferase
MPARPNYGIDAPGWLIGSALAGVAALVVALAFPGLRWAIFPAITWLGYAAGHLWSSKVGKKRRARRLMEAIDWKGDEHVLDVGCGHGLLLIEAAKHLDEGRAVGVDLWRSVDQWGNSPEAAMRNAQLEGVAERVELRDADACELPFPDRSFDVVISSLVVHNIRDRGDQARAVREMARVLKPSGRLMITDIEGTRRYERELRASGLSDVRRTRTPLFLPWTATVEARRP